MGDQIHRSSRGDRTRLGPETGGPADAVAPLKALSQVRDQELEIYFQGPLVAAHAAEAQEVLIRHLARASSPTVVLDLRQVDPIDTSGLSILVEFRKRVTAQGRALILQNPSRPVLRILNITRAGRIFSLRSLPSEDDRQIRTITRDESSTPPSGESSTAQTASQSDELDLPSR